jgi:hypothetical protein
MIQEKKFIVQVAGEIYRSVRHTWPGFVEDDNKCHSYSLTPSNNMYNVLQSGWYGVDRDWFGSWQHRSTSTVNMLL